jgi:hypothetical protein
MFGKKNSLKKASMFGKKTNLKKAGMFGRKVEESWYD